MTLATGRISPVSVIDSVQLSSEVIAGQSEMLQTQKPTHSSQFFAKASVNKALIHWYGIFAFLFLPCLFLTAGSFCCCLQSYDKIFGDFLSPPQTV